MPTRNLLMHGAIQSFDKATGEIVLKTILPLGNDSFRGAATESLYVRAVHAISEHSTKANLFLTALAIEVFAPDALTRFQTP